MRTRIVNGVVNWLVTSAPGARHISLPLVASTTPVPAAPADPCARGGAVFAAGRPPIAAPMPIFVRGLHPSWLVNDDLIQALSATYGVPLLQVRRREGDAAVHS